MTCFNEQLKVESHRYCYDYYCYRMMIQANYRKRMVEGARGLAEEREKTIIML